MHIIYNNFKKKIKFIKEEFNSWQIQNRVSKLNLKKSIEEVENFNFIDFKLKLLNFIKSLQFGDEQFMFRYSLSVTKPTLYASVYALMTLSLLGEINKLSDQQKKDWKKYFDSFQSEIDGLYYDPVVQNEIYNDSDWWGARHLALHIVTAITQLGYKPKYPFLFLRKYYELVNIDKLLDEVDWQSDVSYSNDIDNKLMNIGCLLQYQRDFMKDNEAAKSLEYLKKQLKTKINNVNGIWGSFDIDNPIQLSRMVQFAYHLFSIFFYDNEYDFDNEKIVQLVLKTKNKHNGFGVKLNSSACEDLDSIDILIRLEKYCSPELRYEIHKQIRKSFKWILLNQVEDGGFVFKISEKFIYGSIETSSNKNEAGMFPTWFRTLSIAYIAKYLTKNDNFQITNCPGFEFK